MEQVVSSQGEGAAAAKRLLVRSPGNPSAAARLLIATKTGMLAHRVRQLLALKTEQAAEEARAMLAKAATDCSQTDKEAPPASRDRIDGTADDSATTEAFEGFTVETTVITPDGKLLPGSQACHWRAWRERDMWLDLATRKKWLGSIADEQILIHLREIAADPNAYPDIVFEWRGCTPLHGDQAIAPWFVTICNMGVLVSPGSMTVRQRRRRHQFMVTWKLPAYNGSARGLLNFGRAQGVLWRWADERNRHVVPLNQFALAMRFAHVAFATADETMCRLGELLQQRQDADAWPIDRSTGAAEPTFLAIPKTSFFEEKPTEVRFAVSQELFVEVTTLARDVAHLNGHEDGVLPLIAPSLELQDRRTDEAAWIFQQNDLALNGAEMNRFLAFLFGNVIDINFHDIRHASANAARMAGVPEEAVQALLNHRRSKTSLYYMRRTRRQRMDAHVDSVRRRRTRAAVTVAVRGEIPNAIKV
jgi:hypothetical protein